MGPHVVLEEMCSRRGRESGKLSCAHLCPAESKQSCSQHYFTVVSYMATLKSLLEVVALNLRIMCLLHLQVSQFVTNKRDSAVAHCTLCAAGQEALSSCSLSDFFVIIFP